MRSYSLKMQRNLLCQNLWTYAEIHREELLADWKLAADGQQIFKIDPLK
jgi:hypothetical protein